MTIEDERTQQQLEALRAACLEAARAGYEQAAMAGLCHEGAMEASLDAIRMVDINAVLAAMDGEPAKKP